MPVMRAAVGRPIPDVCATAATAFRSRRGAFDASSIGEGDSLDRASLMATNLSGMPGIGGAAVRGARNVVSNRGAFSGGGGGPSHDTREADFELLVENAISAICAAGERPDPVFGPFAELNSLVRAVTYHEGRLLEQGMARLASENPAYLVMPPETALPIVPAALEVLERNDWKALKGIRLRSEVHYRTSYMPDVFIVDPGQHRALIVDMKRSIASYPERRLDALRNKMMAAALIAADWLHIEGKVAGVTSVEVAVVDGSSERRDRNNGIFALDEIGELIEVGDAGEAMLELRAKFARRIQEEIEGACLRAVGRDPRLGVGGFAAEGSTDEGAVDENGVEPAAINDGANFGGDVDGGAASASDGVVGRRTGEVPEPEPEPAIVGFARGRPR